MRIIVAAITVAVLGWLAANFAGSSCIGAMTATESKINWRSWGEPAFAEAKASGKMVLLFLSPAWCDRCKEMERDAFGADANAELINGNYVAIRVDPDKRPDIYDRYHLGGYPSCVVMTADGRTIGGSLYLPADSLGKLLTNIQHVWTTNQPMVTAQAERLHNLFVGAAHNSKPNPPSELALVMAEDVVKRFYDSTYGGFGTQPKFLLPDVNEFLFGAITPNGSPMFRTQILQTLEAQLALLDTVWGGFYRYASFADWSGQNREKLLDLNARVLSNYLDAYQLTGKESYKRAAEQVIKYLDRFLKSEAGWGFYNSQQGTVIATGKTIDPAEYFAGSDARRLKSGTPGVDKSIYVAANCYAASAYFKASRLLGRQDCADYAERTIDAICAKAVGNGGGMYHEALKSTDAPFGLLADQLACISALLDGYETTGKRSYLSQAEHVASFVTTRLLDTATGGLDYEPTVTSAIARMSVAFRPYGFNCDAVGTWMRLEYLTADSVYKQQADGLLRYLFKTPIREDDLRLCKLANAYLWMYRYPVKFVMVGKRDEAYQRLIQAAWKSYYPRFVVLQLEPGLDKLQSGGLKFPAAEHPSLFVCLDTLRSEPIVDPTTAADKIKEFLRLPAKTDSTVKGK